MKHAPNHSPPGPKGNFIWGNLRELQDDPLGFLTRTAHEYGDIIRFKVGRKTIYQCNHPDYVKEILVTKHRHLRKGGLVKQAKPIFGQGLLSSEGDLHRRQRRILQPIFKRDGILDHAHVITRSTKRLMDRWSEGEVVDIQQAMLDLTLPIIAEILFNIDIGDKTSDIKVAFESIIEQFDRFLTPHPGILLKLPTPGNIKMHRNLSTIEGLIFHIIKECRTKDVPQSNVVSMLINAKDPDGNPACMSDKQIRDEVVTLIAAGHETVATALAWTWYLLSLNPNVQENFDNEISKVLQGRIPIAADVSELAYTRMVFAESMRIYPPIWGISRLVESSFELGPYTLPAGSTVGVSQYVTHRDPRFFPDPELFDPLRWTPEQKSLRPSYSYFPFGGGSRLCIGEPLAWFEAVLILSTIGQRFFFELCNSGEVIPHPRVSLRPKHGIMVKVRKR